MPVSNRLPEARCIERVWRADNHPGAAQVIFDAMSIVHGWEKPVTRGTTNEETNKWPSSGDSIRITFTLVGREIWPAQDGVSISKHYWLT